MSGRPRAKICDRTRWPGIETIAMVENRVERSGETSYERRYYILSAVLLALLFANAVRCHWQIENRLHWMLDVIFRGDLSRLRTGHGPHNTATVRHMAMNLPRSTKPGKSLKVRASLPVGIRIISRLSCEAPSRRYFKRYPVEPDFTIGAAIPGNTSMLPHRLLQTRTFHQRMQAMTDLVDADIRARLPQPRHRPPKIGRAWRRHPRGRRSVA